MTVEIYSDASVVRGRGAWGCVIVGPGGPLSEFSGQLKGHIQSTAHAELMAAANSLHAAIRAGLIKPGDKVRFRVDNQNAVHRIEGKRYRNERRGMRPDLDAMTDWISEQAKRRGFEVRAKWIKGHQPISSPCQCAPHNRRADQLCKVAMGIRKAPKARKATPAPDPMPTAAQRALAAATSLAGAS